ncbi:MAG: GtrA family protein [Spirochaetales bacterium]|nr:GtrA family protein [Spirochaetales bacterium]
MIVLDLIKKYKALIAYVFFGICTTAVDVSIYWLAFRVLSIPNVFSAIIAWFFAVSFAFITNKLWVFESKSFEFNIFWIELIKFYTYRIATGVLEVGMIWLAVDIFHWHAMLCKIISLVIIIIIQFIGSKFWIFINDEKNLT